LLLLLLSNLRPVGRRLDNRDRKVPCCRRLMSICKRVTPSSANRGENTTMTDTIVFTRGVPPPEAFPTDQLAACFDAALRGDSAVVLQYGQQPGYTPLRKLLATESGV